RLRLPWGFPATTHPRATVSRAAMIRPRFSGTHVFRLSLKFVRSWGRGIFGSIVIQYVRRARSPSISALFPVIVHTRSLGTVVLSVTPSGRSVYFFEVSSDSRVTLLIFPLTLSKVMIGLVVAVRIPRMLFF